MAIRAEAGARLRRRAHGDTKAAAAHSAIPVTPGMLWSQSTLVCEPGRERAPAATATASAAPELAARRDCRHRPANTAPTNSSRNSIPTSPSSASVCISRLCG